MGFYRLTDGAYSKVDSIRGNIFWQGAEEKHKYHMARWEMMTRPKDQGGLGIINTKVLVKWVFTS